MTAAVGATPMRWWKQPLVCRRCVADRGVIYSFGEVKPARGWIREAKKAFVCGGGDIGKARSYSRSRNLSCNLGRAQ